MSLTSGLSPKIEERVQITNQHLKKAPKLNPLSSTKKIPNFVVNENPSNKFGAIARENLNVYNYYGESPRI